MRAETKSAVKSFALELLIYATLVGVYVFVVLRLLDRWLVEVFHYERRFYAAIALALVVGQGFVLEIVTRALLRFIMPPREDE